MTKYLEFTESNINLGGPIDALKKTLTAILMEPEFFYRSELGKDGKLAPREAAYAISLALTDCMPDPQLFAAAKSGRLSTKSDYEREVRRILNDDQVAKPRILRFFREYFGYIKVQDIFKEDERYEGHYNPGKPVSYKFNWNVPGRIIDEADMFVEHILEKDKDVLAELLTSSEFFVAPSKDATEDALAKMDEQKRKALLFLLENSNGKPFSKSQSGKLMKTITEDFGIKYNRTHNLNVQMELYKLRFGEDGQKSIGLPPPGREQHASLYNIDYQTWAYETKQPFHVEKPDGDLDPPRLADRPCPELPHRSGDPWQMDPGEAPMGASSLTFRSQWRPRFRRIMTRRFASDLR